MVAILLIYLFAVELNLAAGDGWVPFADDPVANLRSFVLPALTLAFAEWPALMRVLRSDMIATLQEDYIAMAKAKGLRPARILLVHALKPSSLTLVTVAGINIGRLIGGALIVETIFALPGIGRLLVGAIYARDFIILQGVVLFVAAGFVMVNFIVDMLYAVLDPRIRHGRLDVGVRRRRQSLAGAPPAPHRRAVHLRRRLDRPDRAGARSSPTGCRSRARPTWTAGQAGPPSDGHLLGTDHLGRDELSRLIHGGRVSLTVGLLAPVIGVTIGGCARMLAGYFRGRLRDACVGGVDVLLAFPPLVFALAVTAFIGQSVANITW